MVASGFFNEVARVRGGGHAVQLVFETGGGEGVRVVARRAPARARWPPRRRAGPRRETVGWEQPKISPATSCVMLVRINAPATATASPCDIPFLDSSRSWREAVLIASMARRQELTHSQICGHVENTVGKPSRPGLMNKPPGTENPHQPLACRKPALGSRGVLPV
jgi:hypothetical protein